ncbi:Sphingosine N-acyltransferase [Trypanosoma brucei equiperdum]|uniref:Sphingosine N-acyltransferase n=1 Tax=Trypanosoma brucei equiperdum TaxID=630700 RepID=A0A3L6LA21_9TRYP|nr:Sphingosine N-acyltransferase [Trypanosoma brucei equiperdum]
MARQPLGDMYAMTPERAREYGFVSYYNHTGSEASDKLANNITLTSEEWAQLLTSPVQFILQSGGWGGAGFDVTVLPQLLLCLPWTLAFLIFRIFAQRQLSRFGLWLQVVVPKDGSKATLNNAQRRKLRKFQNQVWLTVYYIISAVFGYAVQCTKPWFGLPVSESNRIALLTPHPYKPDGGLMCYYQSGLGFYFSEMLALPVENDIRRSDFVEYFVHHIVTCALIVFSHCSYEHRFGVYVLFIHDASDIMLAAGKVINYVVSAERKRAQRLKSNGGGDKQTKAKPSLLYRVIFNETTVNVCFVLFTLFFVFFRLVCLPYLALANIVYGVKIRMFTGSYCLLIILLQGVLQGLHVYWFTLIMKIVINSLTGKRVDDIRSEDDDDGDGVEGQAVPKNSKPHRE